MALVLPLCQYLCVTLRAAASDKASTCTMKVSQAMLTVTYLECIVPAAWLGVSVAVLGMG